MPIPMTGLYESTDQNLGRLQSSEFAAFRNDGHVSKLIREHKNELSAPGGRQPAGSAWWVGGSNLGSRTRYPWL